MNLTRLQINNTYRFTVLQIGHLLTVRAIAGLETCGHTICKTFFLNVGTIGHDRFLIISDFGFINAPDSTALTVIDNRTTVGTEIYPTFPLRSLGYLFGGIEVHCGDIDIAIHDKGNFFAIGRNGHMSGSTRAETTNNFIGIHISHNTHIHLGGFSSWCLCVKFTIVGIRQYAIVRNGEITYGISLEVGQLGTATIKR